MGRRIKIYYGDGEGICFKVPSSRESEGYQYVSWDIDNGWSCTCEHYQFRKAYCKHMKLAKQFLYELNDEVQNCSEAFRLE